MNNIDVSVVIPAYNAEEFIEKTIHSVLSQSAEDFSFEVLLIDDGSSDNTLKIAQTISENNKRLLVFTQKNSGSPSKPRNRGIDLARGKYILFLDADDFLCPNALTSMYKEAITSKNQIILGKFIGKNGRRVPNHIFMKTNHKADLLEDMAWHNLSPTAKLCALEPIKRYGLRFFEDQWIGEDQNFFANLYFKAEGISILSDQIYVEVGLSDNGTNLTTRQQTLNDKAKTSVRLGNVIRENTVKGIVRDRLSQRIFTSTLPSVINQFYAKETPFQRQKFVYNMHTYLSDLYSKRHKSALSQKVEIAYALMFAGLVDDLDLLLCGKEDFDPIYVLKNNKLCLELPEKLSKQSLKLIEQISLPKNLVKSNLTSIVKIKENTLHISLNIETLKIKAKPKKIDIILRERRTGEEIIINSKKTYQFDNKTNSWIIQTEIIIDKSIYISKGAWGTFYRIYWGDETSIIEDRWGKRTLEIENQKFGIKLNNEDLIAYFNQGYENLTFDIGYTVHSKTNQKNLFK